MTNKTTNSLSLSGNVLKVIAALSMLVDHVGHILFPEYTVLRIIGRISMPIFAYMIAEGCYYTKDRKRYFLSVFVLAVVCQAAYYLYDGSLEMGILVTFSLSILAVYSLQYMKERLFSGAYSHFDRIRGIGVFLISVAAVYIINRYVSIDYGFWGCMLPVFAEASRQNRRNKSAILERVDLLSFRVLMFGAGLMLLSVSSSRIQVYSLFAIPLLLLYSGKRGKKKMKSFFYVFYPVHLLVLEVIAFLIV